MVAWNRDDPGPSLSGPSWGGTALQLFWNMNVTDQVTAIILKEDKSADPANFRADARRLIKEEMDVLFGKSGLRGWVSSGNNDYIKQHQLDEKLQGQLVIVYIMCSI
jgi:hypothetical protein